MYSIYVLIMLVFIAAFILYAALVKLKSATFLVKLSNKIKQEFKEEGEDVK